MFPEEDRFIVKYKFNETLKNINYMFCSYISMITIDFQKVDSRNVTKLCWLFSYCYNLTNSNFSAFHTEKVRDMSRMFYISLKE